MIDSIIANIDYFNGEKKYAPDRSGAQKLKIKETEQTGKPSSVLPDY
jgi:hypothetical protein